MDSPSRYATGEGNLVRKSTGKDDGKKNMGMSPLQPPVLHGDASSLTQLPNPNAPKRGLSAYMLFANETREKIREEYPGINLGDVGRILGEKWKSLSEERKAPFEAMAADEKKRYDEDKATYIAANSTHDLNTKEDTKHKSPDADSACHLFESSIRRYGTLLLHVQREASQSTRLTTSTVPELKDEFSRLRIWGEQTYAVLPRNARRSLDEQLREDKETREIVTRTLRRLDSHIGRAIDQTVTHFSTADIADEEDEEHSSSSDESDTAQEVPQTAWEIAFRKTVSMIFEGIRSLYRISNLLRRPRNSSKYLKSSNSIIPSHDALKVTMDYAHIVEKIRQWRHLTMRSKVGGDEEPVVTEEEIQLRKGNVHQEIADIAFLCQRLTWANLFRRKQFDYWVDCPDVPESQETPLNTAAKQDRLKGQIFSALGASFSTVAKSALSEDKNGEQWHTIYAKSAIGRSNPTRVPDVPRCSKTDTNFECPFCHIILDSNSMQKREVWKKHVFRDLRPYVCSFEDCPDPGRLFITRHDWIYHEQQMHRRRWTCPHKCAKSLSSKAAMVQHLTSEHSSIVNKQQLSTYADMCEREIDDTTPDTCLICSRQMSLSRLHDHLATHMEEIALFVLPLTSEDDDEDERIQEIAEDVDEHDDEDERIQEIAEDIVRHENEDEQIETITEDLDNSYDQRQADQGVIENPDKLDYLIWQSEAAQEAADDQRSLESIDQYQQQTTDQQALPSFFDRWRSRNREPVSQAAADDLLDSSIGNRFQYDLDKALQPGKTERTKKQKEPDTFQCSVCPKTFTRAYNLRSHMRTHTDEKRFVCIVCGKAFARQHDRKRHEDTVHKDGAVEWSAANQSHAAGLAQGVADLDNDFPDYQEMEAVAAGALKWHGKLTGDVRSTSELNLLLNSRLEAVLDRPYDKSRVEKEEKEQEAREEETQVSLIRQQGKKARDEQASIDPSTRTGTTEHITSSPSPEGDHVDDASDGSGDSGLRSPRFYPGIVSPPPRPPKLLRVPSPAKHYPSRGEEERRENQRRQQVYEQQLAAYNRKYGGGAL